MLKQPPRDKRKEIGTSYFTAFPDFCGKKIPFRLVCPRPIIYSVVVHIRSQFKIKITIILRIRTKILKKLWLVVVTNFSSIQLPQCC